MDEGTLNVGSVVLLGAGLAIAAAGWITALVRRHAPPWGMWFVGPGIATAWSLGGGCWLAFGPTLDGELALAYGWEAMGVATLACGVMLGAGAQSAAVLALRAGPIDVRRAALPFGCLALGGTVTALITARSGYWELGVLPAALCIGGIGPCAARAATSEGDAWLDARARAVAMYGGAVACGLASLGCLLRVQLGVGPTSGIDDALVAAVETQLAPCALAGAAVTASCIGPRWRRAWPVAVATCGLLAPWLPIDQALYRRLEARVPSGAAEDATSVALPLGVDLLGRWPRWTTLASAPCRARLDGAAWTVTARGPVDAPCAEWLLLADGSATVGALSGAPGTDGPGFLLAVRGAGGPRGGLRQLRVDRRFVSAESPPMPPLGPDAHAWLRARSDAAFATGDDAAFLADPAWTVDELVQVCLSSRPSWSPGCAGWIQGSGASRGGPTAR